MFATDEELAVAITAACKNVGIDLPCARSLAGSVFDAATGRRKSVKHHAAGYRDRFQWHKTHRGQWTVFGIEKVGTMVVTAIGHHQNKTIGGRGNNGYNVDFETGVPRPNAFKLPNWN